MKLCKHGIYQCICEFDVDWRKLIPEGVKLLDLINIPPIPKDAQTCGFCAEKCGNEWCCVKDEK